MKYLILIPILLLTQCLSRDCTYYYYYSPKHEEALELDSTYKPRYVEGHRFTLQVNYDYLYKYRELWNDPTAQRVYTGCIDTLHITENKAP